MVGLGLVLSILGWWVFAGETREVSVPESGQAARPPAAGRLTIDTLIDIKHPGAPVWSRDSKV
jgi:hypothetical protein